MIPTLLAQKLVSWMTAFPWEGMGQTWMILLFIRSTQNNPLHAYFTAGFMLLAEPDTTTDLTVASCGSDRKGEQL